MTVPEQYELQRALRASKTAPVYLAAGPDGAQVVIKSMSFGADPHGLRRLTERFEALRAMENPAIPRHLDFRVDGTEVTWITEFVPGEALSSWIVEGKRFTEREIFEFLVEILDILAVLHEQSVVHRDLKPENIIAKPDGSYALIDFAGANLCDETGNVSVLGTTGYAAPEQLVGDAVPQSDQYGLAATALHLVTGRHPTEFPLRNLRIDLQVAKLSPGLEHVLSRMLDPDPVGRFEDCRTAAASVRRDGALPEFQWALARTDPLRGSVVRYEATPGSLLILVAPRRPRALKILGGITLLLLLLLFALLAYAVLLHFAWPLFLILAYLPMKFLFMEIRRLARLKIEISQDGWSVEEQRLLTTRTFAGSGRLDAWATGVVATGDSQAPHLALALVGNGKVTVVGRQLWAIEARAISAAIRAFGRDDSSRALPAPQSPPPSSTALVAAAPGGSPAGRMKVSPLRKLAWHYLVKRPLDRTEAETAALALPPEFAQKVKSLGFELYGGFLQRDVAFPKSLVYGSADGATLLTVTDALLAGSEAGVSYRLATVFDDGRLVSTFGTAIGDPVRNRHLIRTPTSGSLAEDVMQHRRLVSDIHDAQCIVVRNGDATTLRLHHTISGEGIRGLASLVFLLSLVLAVFGTFFL